VLIVEDPDAPSSTPPLHALSIGIDPALGQLPENGLVNPSPVPGLRHGRGGLGRMGWAGPLPPASHGPHTYVFQLFALDYDPDLGSIPGRGGLVRALVGHVLDYGIAIGTYARPD